MAAPQIAAGESEAAIGVADAQGRLRSVRSGVRPHPQPLPEVGGAPSRDGEGSPAGARGEGTPAAERPLNFGGHYLLAALALP